MQTDGTADATTPVTAPRPLRANAPTIMRGWSLEAALPQRAEIGRLARLVAPGTRVYLTALPHAPFARQLAAARSLREAGLEPVPHVAARHLRNEEELAVCLRRMTGEAGVRRLLAIGGDPGVPRGGFSSSLEIIRSRAFRNSGIEEVGVAGYPGGHPVIPEEALMDALDAKIESAREAGLAIHLVTQFCFEAAPILGWVRRLAERGIDVPVRIGLAGPASPRTLLTFALRCGVDLPLRKANVAANLLRGVSPDRIVRDLETGGIATTWRGPVSVHLYSFGGLERTAAWARDAEAAFASPAA